MAGHFGKYEDDNFYTLMGRQGMEEVHFLGNDDSRDSNLAIYSTWNIILLISFLGPILPSYNFSISVLSNRISRNEKLEIAVLLLF